MSGFTTSRFRSLLLCAGLFSCLLGLTGSAFAEAPNAEVGGGALTSSSTGEPRVALVIGNANYQSAPKLANPDNDARSMAQLLTSAGFEVTEATDLTRNDMLKAVQDFSARVAARGPKTVAMVYYAGHGVQLAGENYLLPVDAKIATPADLDGNSLRLVDLMGTLETIPSRMRIVVLDACRNNPFPGVNDTGRGLAIVDAPNGSIVGYSTAPGMEAQDGDSNHSPYTSAFLRRAREPNLPIEQLFKRVRLDVNDVTDGRQTPWESSSLTSEFYFFGDTAVAAARSPDRSPIIQTASNLPSRSVRQAYDYVLSEASPEYYEEFIRLYPRDPLCDRIRHLLGNWLEATAWHKAVLANSPVVYKSFHDSFANSPYAQSALRLQAQPRNMPLMQFTRLTKPGFNTDRPGLSKDGPGMQDHGPMQGPSKIVTLPGKGTATTGTANGGISKDNPGSKDNLGSKDNPGGQAPSKIVTPAKGTTTGTTTGTATTSPTNTGINGGNNGNPGKVTTLPARTNTNANPIRIKGKSEGTVAPRKFGGGFGGGNSGPGLASSSSRGSGGGGSSGGNGGFKH
ncbi:MAG: caspase family protein [Bradyrhizobium sp.]